MRSIGIWVAVLGLAAQGVSAQQLSIGAGSSWSLSNASLDLGCSDLVVAGTWKLETAGVTQVLDVSIPGGGSFDGGSGTLDVTGDWSRSGSFNAGTGVVRFVDGCGTSSSTILDGNSFYDLSLQTSAGKQIRFEAGATTTVGGMFLVSGASGNLLSIRSTLNGSEAFLNLAAANMGSFVDVQDNHVTPAVLLDGASPVPVNASGWSFVSLVPALQPLALITLVAALHWAGRRALRYRAVR